MATGPSVIPATKLHVPSIRAGIVACDGLVEALICGRAGNLTLAGGTHDGILRAHSTSSRPPSAR